MTLAIVEIAFVELISKHMRKIPYILYSTVFLQNPNHILIGTPVISIVPTSEGLATHIYFTSFHNIDKGIAPML